MENKNKTEIFIQTRTYVCARRLCACIQNVYTTPLGAFALYYNRVITIATILFHHFAISTLTVFSIELAFRFVKC